MLLSLLGLFIVLGVALLIWAPWLEKSLWAGAWQNWRTIFPGYREADRLKVYSDGQNKEIDLLITERNTLHDRVHDVDGLEAQVADLKQVLEWTRTSLNDAKQEVLAQIGESYQLRETISVHKAVLLDYRKSLRQRATLIRELEEHVAERDNVIDNLRVLLEAQKRSNQKSAMKFTRKSVLDKRR